MKRGPKTLFKPKEYPTRSHLMTALCQRILRAAVDRTGASESEIVEQLVRLHGGRVTAQEMAPLDEPTVEEERP